MARGCRRLRLGREQRAQLFELAIGHHLGAAHPGPPTPPLPPCSAAGCLKNVVVVWGGILHGDFVTARELQASIGRAGGVGAWNWSCVASAVSTPGACLVPATKCASSYLTACRPPHLQGYGISLLGFLLYSAARLRRPMGTGVSTGSQHQKHR